MLKKIFVFLISFLLFITNGFSVSAEAEQTAEEPSTSEKAKEDSSINKKELFDAEVQADEDKDIRDITLDVAEEAVFTEAYQNIYYRFVPETSRKYVFESFDANGDPYAALYDENFSMITYDDDGADDGDGNFRLVCDLTEGTTYYFCAKVYGEEEEASYSVVLYEYEEQKPTYIGFRDEEFILRKNTSYNLRDFIEVQPYDAEYTLTAESSDENIISCTGEMMVTGNTAGKATVTVATDNGMSASTYFIVGNYASSITRDNYDDIYLGFTE